MMGGALHNFMKYKSFSAIAAITLALAAGGVHAAAKEQPLRTGGGLQPLEEEELSRVTGEGIAIGLEDIRLATGPSTRLEIIGEDVPGDAFQRADARWYGFTLSGDDPQSTWVGSCGAGIDGMGCPIGGQIEYLAPFDNPYLLRTFDYEGISYLGPSTTQTVFELLGPTEHDPYRYSAWVEFVIGGTEYLQGQAMLSNARLFREDGGERHNSKIRMLSHTDPDDPTIAFIWHNHWQGDFRYSVNQAFSSQDAEGVPPLFTDVEGFYARGLDVYMPLGHMFYQSLVLDHVPDENGNQTGNFRLELTRPNPNADQVLEDFYSTADASGYQRTGRPDRYYETHGHFRIGDWTPSTTCERDTSGEASNCIPAMTGTMNTPFSTDSGLFFVARDQQSSGAEFFAYAEQPEVPTGDDLKDNYTADDGFNTISAEAWTNQVNLGDGRIEGMLIQHMELRTLGIE